MHRRTFLQQSATALAGTMVADSLMVPGPKKRIAMVGTGVRGLGMWGEPVIREFGDSIEFVGLCDINPGRVETGRKFLKLSCPTFTDFDKMMKETKPETL